MPALVEDPSATLLTHHGNQALSRAAHPRFADLHGAIFNSLPGAIAVIDHAGLILEVNESWQRLVSVHPFLGTTALPGRNYLDLCNLFRAQGAAHAAVILQGLRAMLAGELPEFVHEFDSQTHAQTHWFHLRATPLHSGRHDGALLVFSEITKRKQAEESLRRTEFKYRSIFENATEGIFQTTPSGNYLVANPMLAKIYGYDSPAELMEAVQSIAHQVYVNPRRRDEFIQVMAAQGVVFQFESAIYRKDGQIIWISENARAVRGERGELLYYEGTVEDITDLKNAQERISNQAALLDKARDAIFVRDLQHRILYWNQSAERIYGWTAAEVVGRSALGLVCRDTPEFQNALGLVLTEGGWSGEIKQFRKDGSEVMVEARYTLVRDAAGRPKSILAIDTDVTEKKRLEKQLVHSQRMESIGTLAGGIAHDFNNILTIIFGYAQMARTALPADHALQRNLAAIERASTRAEGVVRQILTFSRQQETERRVIELPPVVQEALQFLRTTLPAKIEIQAEFEPQLPPIHADATQLHQIIMNLGTNAAHAMRYDGGRLAVRVNAITFDGSQFGHAANLSPGRYLHLAISDTGCGMDPATLSRVFEPFFTTKRVGEGTGLGLAVVHGIVESHGGTITVYSEVGKGTLFHLYFPALDSVPAMSAPSSVQKFEGRGRRILYVDDEEAIVTLTSQNLQNHGFAVAGFHHPEEALAAFETQAQAFDAAVLDMSMPRMDGPELARLLLRIRPGFPIIMATGFVRVEDHDKVRRLGIRKIIEKPNTIFKLGAALDEVLNPSASRLDGP